MTSLLRAVEGKLWEVGGERVRSVRIAVGALSGVEPELLKTAFEFLSPGTVADKADFVVRVTPIRLQCRSCKNEFDLEEISFNCPQCKSNEIELTGGEELVIEEMEVEFGNTPGTSL